MLQCKNDIHFNPKSAIVPVFHPYYFSISQLFKPRFFVIYIYKTLSEFPKGNIMLSYKCTCQWRIAFSLCSLYEMSVATAFHEISRHVRTIPLQRWKNLFSFHQNNSPLSFIFLNSVGSFVIFVERFAFIVFLLQLLIYFHFFQQPYPSMKVSWILLSAKTQNRISTLPIVIT